MDVFSKSGGLQFPKKHHRCISLESGETLSKKSYPKTTNLDMPRFFPRRYSTPELAMRKHALKHHDDGGVTDVHLISNKSCQTDILGLDKYLQRPRPPGEAAASRQTSAAVALQQQRTAYKKSSSKKPKVRSVGVHCERRRLTFAAFKGCQKFKHVYKRKISLPQPRSRSPATTASDDSGPRDSGVLPKLWPDRVAAEAEKPVAAAKAAGPTIKLPRIPMTKDAKLEPDRTDDGAGGGTRLARLTRPQSTGSGSSADTAHRKLAYFRASSAPKIDSRYNTTLCFIASSAPAPAAQPTERELQSTTPGSSDTADTTLEMSYVVQHQPESADDDVVMDGETDAEVEATATVATTGAMSSCTTRTVSTSTCSTFAAEPIFPIVFSCESVLRHPLDAGGYVSHTESHRFSVHYVPVEESQAATNDDDDGSRSSSLVFTSSGRPCQNNERRLTGDSISVTPSTVPMSSNTTGERRLVIEHMNTDVQFRNVVTSEVPDETPSVEDDSLQQRSFAVEEPRSEEHYRFSTAVVDDDRADVKTPKNIAGQNIEDVIIVQNENSVPVRKNMSDNKIIDHFGDGGEGDEATKFIAHAHCTDMPLQQSDNEQNYERLTQNHQNTFDSDRTVSNQSPKFDGTETQIERQSVLKPDTHATAADELDLLLHSSLEPKNDEIDGRRDDEPEQQQIDNDNHCSTEVLEVTGHHSDDEPGRQQIDNDNHCSTGVLEVIGHHPDEKPAGESDENTEVMASRQCRKQHGGETTARKPGTENSNHATAGENSYKPTTQYPANDHRSAERNDYGDKLNVPNRLYGNISNGKRTTDDGRDVVNGDVARNSYRTRRSDNNNMINRESKDRDGYGLDDVTDNTAGAAENVPNDQYYGLFAGKRSNDLLLDDVGEPDDANNIGERRKYDTNRYGTMDAMERCDVDSHHVRADKDADTNACRRCAGKNNETDALSESRNYDYRNLYGVSHGKHPQQYHPMSKRRLESVDETAESTKQANYIGGFLFGDAFYNRKQPQKYETADPYDRRGNNHVYHYNNKYEYYDDSKKVNFSSRSNDRYEYYQDYAPKNRHSPRDEDCTVFADVKSSRKSCKDRGGIELDPRYPSTAAAAAAQTSSYYSRLQTDQPASYGDDCSKNTDSDESLTDSLEDGCKFEGAAVSYFLTLDGQKSAVTFTLKMPDTLENRLNRRHSLLKKHLHVTTTVRKVASTTRVRTRHKGCQTLWTEEKGVQVQRGSTATARKPAVDDHKVLETLLAGLERHRVSENQIRVVGGQKMVSEGNQTESQPPSDRQTQTTRDAAAGPETPEKNAVAEATAGQGHHHKSHTVKKFSSDNALMVGVVRQNKYKGKEAVDGVKNDQLLTLSKGWINFYTLRADSADAAEAQELNDNDDEEIKSEDDGQQYTVHVQAIPEPVVLPVLHVPNRNVLQVPKTCSTTKHLPRLVQTETNNNNTTHQQNFSSHLATENGWCVSVDGPNNMHMKVSLLPDKSDVKSSEHFDLNEENKLEARRLALQRKNNYMRKPYRNIKRTQSTPRDMFSADVSRTESALSAESKYIETIDTQLLIHKARRRLSQEWDTRIQNRGVTESVQLVVTGDSVSSRTSQHYATRGHQHCSFRRQSRRI